MSGQPFPGVPVNPRLKFGVPLVEVYQKGILHRGLRELFLKAYLSAGGYDRTEDEQFNRLLKIPHVLEALKAGIKGQGSLAERMSLKLKVESGKWIIATQVPAGAPLWLLRHFLGCLPRPLLDGSDWRTIAIACEAVSRPKKNRPEETELLDKISTALEALPMANCLILVALVLLIRNLSMLMPSHDSGSVTLHEEAVEALSRYFTAAVISRPYRPGLYTVLDKDHQPLLVFLSERWLEVKELCQRAGISRYHNTCESRYEFVSPDTEVDHTMRHALATGQNVDEEIDAPESLARKPNQHLSRIANQDKAIGGAVEESMISRNEIKPVDTAVEISEIKSLPVTVQMPKGVYLISPKTECDRTSVVDEGTTKKMVECFDDAGQRCIQVDNRETDYFGYILLRKDESDENPKFDAKDLISEYEREAVVFVGANQAFRSDGLPSERKVTVRINGTQTFACEFTEDSHAKEVKKFQEKTNELQGLPGRVEMPQEISRQHKPVKNIGPSDGSKIFSKICGKRTSIPLTKSTALLVKNFTSDEEMVYSPTMSDLIVLPNGKMIGVETEQLATRLEKYALVSKTDEEKKASINPVKDGNTLSYRKANSNYTDFVTELKNNFKEGRRRPSLAKSSSSDVVLKDNSRGLDVVTSSGQGTLKIFRIGELLGEKETSFPKIADSSSSQELFPKRYDETISFPNSARKLTEE